MSKKRDISKVSAANRAWSEHDAAFYRSDGVWKIAVSRSLDVTDREDESRIQNKHMRENFAWLRHLTLSLLKHHPGRESVAMKRRSCGWSDDFMMEVLTGATI